MGATWRTLGTLCRELGWSKQRLLYELQNGRVCYRTIPEGWTIDDWLDPYLRPYLNVEASEILIPYGTVSGAIVPPPPKKHLGREEVILGIEVLPPTAPDVSPAPEPSPPPPSAPQTTAPPKTVSNEDLGGCILAIVSERPDAPLGRDELWAEVESRLGQWVARDRVWAARKRFAPQWVSRRGRRRKPAQ
jgi:hypothetical protein